ncbi:MAG: outer membrane protein assembly factor BamA [Gammaproteobacteria bacterium]|nr:outer membrane protein assembly factor BamA [Gammaproteobacteria bacterium]MDA7971901.1 outer membrane protein assembly factor BamA [Gammaproteobacteria bacterium]MDA8007137.1 outer membrane protein assembly factor BamA [Gammaproteobacteria bacterium]MDA8011317.1 outer membrane protein assembly factor BamA [Gammaproteobacteria bacterium]MDA8014163.1 outer membrane protein assembly factor BamA [Gammaproteobacteria bacterium]
MKRLAPLLLWLHICAALAAAPFIITDIRVEGLERLEAGTVFNYLPLKVGDELNDEEARLSIKELYATGFFKDVVLERDGTALVVKVVERPSIATLTITGNKVIDTETLQRGLGQAGLVEGRILNSASLDRVEQEIQSTYLSLGRYSTKVESEVEELERNRVAVTIKISEGRVATIKKINIIGAKQVPVDALVEEMSLRDRRGFGLFSSRNQYSKQKLEADLEKIRSYYLDRGFHEFEIVSSNVDISANKQNIFISIILNEGERYVFEESVFEATGSADTSGLPDLVSIRAGEPFSRKTVNASRAAISRKFADDGYAFVEVRPIYETDREAKTVKTVFTIETKQRVYVRKVIISGNLHTRDQVIRRELRQFEGAWYSARAVKLSEDRLKRAGYFTGVSIETQEVSGATDQVDLRVAVQERDTGSISFSLGYSDADGAILGANYAQRNLLGTGRELNVNVDSTATTNSASIRYVNPYHTPDGVSREISISSIDVDTTAADTAIYRVNTTASGVNYKIPIAETNSLNLGFSLEDIRLSSTGSTPTEIRKEFDDQKENNPGSNFNLISRLGVSKDTRNDFFFPTGGATSSVSVEATVPGSAFEYYKFNLRGTAYRGLFTNLAMRAGFTLSHGGGYGDTEELPAFRRYYAGGSHSVRGFRARNLGPYSSQYRGAPTKVDEANPPCGDDDMMGYIEFKDGCYRGATMGAAQTPIGGDTRVLVNTELLFPAFGAGDKRDKRIGIFLDGGMAFGKGFEHIEASEDHDTYKRLDGGIDLGRMRYSAGVSFNWFSPIGPFSMSYSEPLNEEPGDRVENFQISLGTLFR